jgi:hypothetical protein
MFTPIDGGPVHGQPAKLPTFLLTALLHLVALVRLFSGRSTIFIRAVPESHTGTHYLGHQDTYNYLML